jgi:hypothetical protein
MDGYDGEIGSRNDASISAITFGNGINTNDRPDSNVELDYDNQGNALLLLNEV